MSKWRPYLPSLSPQLNYFHFIFPYSWIELSPSWKAVCIMEKLTSAKVECSSPNEAPIIALLHQEQASPALHSSPAHYENLIEPLCFNGSCSALTCTAPLLCSMSKQMNSIWSWSYCAWKSKLGPWSFFLCLPGCFKYLLFPLLWSPEQD